ncbi:MAG: Hsp70 family protein [Thermoguttaceae bacterium]|nr:Hsp70 family protein [Thermoguttaceae bacterium]
MIKKQTKELRVASCELRENVTAALTRNTFIVGIDLGTTNSAVMSIDLSAGVGEIESFPLFQKTAPGESDNRLTLPSFLFIEPSGDVEVGTYARDFGALQPGRLIWSAKSWLCHSQVDRTAAFLPWKASDDVKKMSPVDAQSQYLKFIADRWNDAHPNAPLDKQDIVITLPASFDETARQLTIRAAAKAGLNKVVLIEEPQAAFYAWIYKISGNRELGIGNSNSPTANLNTTPYSLLPTPSPTAYCLLPTASNNCLLPTASQTVLVIDVGGGTSDFSLIRIVQENQSDSENSDERHTVSFHRIAVGDHLLLGGDNLDLALAKLLESKFAQQDVKLTDRQWQTLVRQSRIVKETLLGENAPETCTASIPAAGSKLMAKSLYLTVTKEEVVSALLEGFFPFVDLTAKPDRRRSGFQEFGLPFASDPAITRYLAAFLTNANCSRPDAVLFNGGMFESPLTKQRILDQLSHWFSPADGEPWRPVVLDNDALDLAVARGAAYFGLIRYIEKLQVASGITHSPTGELLLPSGNLREGLKRSIPSLFRIHATLARSYYIGLEHDGKLRAMCIAPADIQEGQTLEIQNDQLRLQTNAPVVFPLFVSSSRTTDKPGEIIDLDENQMRALAPLRTVIKLRGETADSLRVNIQTHLTDSGALELYLASNEGSGRWRLNFDIRSAVETDVQSVETTAESEGIIDENKIEQSKDVLKACFERFEIKPSEVVKRITGIIGQSRETLPAPALRSLFDALMELEPGRKKSATHEARWLNLAGFFLRPGIGASMDDWRIEQIWKSVFGKLRFPQPDNRLQLWILWRRVAAGLSSGRQIQLIEPILRQLRSLCNSLNPGSRPKAKGRNEWFYTPHESAELSRLFGAMEKLPVNAKQETGDLLLSLLSAKETPGSTAAILWSVGRLGARASSITTMETILSPDAVEPWVRKLIGITSRKTEFIIPESERTDAISAAAFAVVLTTHKTGDRYRDVSDSLRTDALRFLESVPDVKPRWLTLVRDGGSLQDDDRAEEFGESLPTGLRIVNSELGILN